MGNDSDSGNMNRWFDDQLAAFAKERPRYEKYASILEQILKEAARPRPQQHAVLNL